MKFFILDKNKLTRELSRLSSIKLEAVQQLQLRDMLNRARSGGTPVDTGELRQSSFVDTGSLCMGYNKEYAAHVEYGHRTRGGGFVPGQRYLQRNVDAQRPIYKEDLLREIRKG